MKHSRRLVAGAAVLASLLVMATGTWAQMGPGPMGGGTMGKGGMRGNGDSGLTVERRLEHLTSRLNLTAEQREQIRPVLLEEEGKLNEVRKDGNLTRDQQREKFRAIHTETYEKFRPVLTPEQQQKHDTMRDEAEKRMAPPPK